MAAGGGADAAVVGTGAAAVVGDGVEVVGGGAAAPTVELAVHPTF